MRPFLLLLLAAAYTGCAAQADSDGFVRESGTLASGDETLRSGEFVDRYTVSTKPGQWIEVAMTSSAFDPHLILQPPGCRAEQSADGTCEGQLDNDDVDSSDRKAFVWAPSSQGGTWTIMATSSAPGESGAYEVAYRVAEAGETPTTPGIEELTGNTARRVGGTLVSGDKTLQSGEFVDYYAFFGRRGQPLVVDLRSSAFDPYLILSMPGGEQLDNDDYEGDRSRSVIETTLPADGMYRVGVTTYQPGESGAYEVQLLGAAGVPASEDGGSPDPFTKQ